MTHADSAPPRTAKNHPPHTAETVWLQLRAEAALLLKTEPALAALAKEAILAEDNILSALARMLSVRLASADVSAATLRDLFTEAHRALPELGQVALSDLASILTHDPAAHDALTPFLFFKGFHALQTYRVSHWLWQKKRRHMALYLQNRVSDLFGVDIHPAARMGRGVMLDHATGIVIGETSTVDDDVLIWHGVTLGGKELVGGDRHPKIGKGVLLGAGCSVLGPIEVGAGARVAAGSVVLENVPAGATVAGIPAKVVKKA